MKHIKYIFNDKNTTYKLVDDPRLWIIVHGSTRVISKLYVSTPIFKYKYI
jgi:hypothetical protein